MLSTISTFILLLFGILITQNASATSNTTPKILVTIKPLHSLVTAITQGVTEPQLLLNTVQSAHNIRLRPSDYRKLSNANVVFWAGAELETFIPVLTQKYQNRAKFVSLMQVKDVALLPIRNKYAHHHTHQTRYNDPHFWLSSHNAKKIVLAVTQTLISLDNKNKENYLNNQKRTLARINTLAQKISKPLHDIKAPFISYHDAYQYFEKEHNLNRIASVNLNEETTPSIKQIQLIKNLIAKHGVHCIFYEAPSKPAIINTLMKNQATTIQAVELDILGRDLTPGIDLWFTLLENMANQMTACLLEQ